MEFEDFCYWLQGHFEMNPSDVLSESQIKMIREHLSLVFNKVTPDLDLTEATLPDALLSDIHLGINRSSNRRYCSGIQRKRC